MFLISPNVRNLRYFPVCVRDRLRLPIETTANCENLINWQESSQMLEEIVFLWYEYNKNPWLMIVTEEILQIRKERSDFQHHTQLHSLIFLST